VEECKPLIPERFSLLINFMDIDVGCASKKWLLMVWTDGWIVLTTSWGLMDSARHVMGCI
jgi:hypothetical protein